MSAMGRVEETGGQKGRTRMEDKRQGQAEGTRNKETRDKSTCDKRQDTGDTRNKN